MARYMLILAAVAALLVSAVSGAFLVPFLHKVHFGQTIKTVNGPAWHAKKQGTPTMGGFCFVLGLLAALGLVYITIQSRSPELLGGVQLSNLGLCLLSAFGFGIIGFADDYIKVVKKRNLGLRAWQKVLGQIIVTTGLLAGLNLNGSLSTAIVVPGLGYLELGFWFMPLSYLLIIFMTNAVNLTDGIDGLASCVTFVVMLGYLTISSLLGQYHLSLYASALAGALAGFLVWNFYPAKTFMGDTGSMFLGGSVVGLAYCMNRPELLLFLGAVYIWEAGSVVIQVAYFKLTHGKRIFKMTPIHHSFEMSGWSEVKIDGVFSFVALAGVLLALLYVRMN